MKTPREVLLARHQAAEPKLDALRREVLTSLSPTESRRGEGMDRFAAACRELFRMPRWAWSGLAAAWLIIVALNIAARETPEGQPMSSTVANRSSDTLQAIHEQKQLFAELVGMRPESDAEVPRFIPRPRSECAGSTACA